MTKAPNSCVASLPQATVASQSWTFSSTPTRFMSAWMASAMRVHCMSLIP